MKSKKGFTTVELLVTFTLVTVIVFFLFEILLTLKDLYVSTGIKTKLLTKQAVISETINDDLYSGKVKMIRKCSDGDVCIEFTFNNIVNPSGSDTKKLVIYRGDGRNSYVKYGELRNNLVEGSQFGNVAISYENLLYTTNDNIYNGILTIDVPIYHRLLEQQDYGFQVIYQYNTNVTSVAGINQTSVVDSEKTVTLLGSENDIKFKGIAYSDPGYTVYDKQTGNLTYSVDDLASTSPIVKVTGKVGDTVGETYYITYTIYDMNGSKMSEVSRAVTVLARDMIFEYTGTAQEYIVPINGTYLIEAWGASGGGSSIMKGRGGYTSSTISLNKGDKIYAYVGGKGLTGTSGVAAPGGYNGGGASGVSTSYYASSGGGASDLRLNSNDASAKIIVAGGGGGGGSRNEDNFACIGGHGGGLAGLAGSCSTSEYAGSGGSQKTGGAAATYETNMTTTASAGSLGTGGAGGTYKNSSTSYASGGGGGGYYGGGGGARYGSGGGGSSYCSSTLKDCETIDGNNTFPAKDGVSYEKGHDGNGNAKITLKSIKYTTIS